MRTFDVGIRGYQNLSGQKPLRKPRFLTLPTDILEYRMKKFFLLLYIICTFSALADAQPQARMQRMRHEFGTVLWNEPVQTTFVVTNKGNRPLYILRVHPDCGCTAVDWTRDSIAPGQDGIITATMDAELLGHFDKQLEVLTNADTQPIYLTLSGDVVRERKDYQGDFPYQIGELYLDKDNVEFDDVRTGDHPRGTLRIYNAGRQSYTPELMHLPKYLSAKMEPEVIRPGRTGKVYLTLDSEQIRWTGLTQTNIYLSRYPGDRVSRDNEIFISTTLLPELSYTRQELENAPIATLDSLHIDLGKMDGKKKVKGKLQLTNTGKSDLIISTLQVYNPGLGVSIGKRKLKPGQSADIKITVGADNKYFKGRRSILLITNDPLHPKMVIDIKVEK